MWALAGKSITGTAHASSGLPCQDHWAMLGAGATGERILLALADGAGFAKLADVAARIAVERALALMAACECDLKDIGEADIIGWLTGVRQRLESEASASGVELTDYSCTLLGALIENGVGHFWQLGDGGWVVQSANGIEVATWPSSGEFINQTVFVSSDGYREKWTQAGMKDITAVLGFTDGLEHIALDYPTRSARETFVGKLFAAVSSWPQPADVESQISSLLSSQLVNERTDDDKTMVLAWRIPAEANVHG
jgi:Protein phosphatase 2C